MFSFDKQVLELVVRASILYISVLVLIRILPRRTGGEMGMADLIFVLLVAQAIAPSFGDYRSLSDGMVVVVTLMAWNYMVNFASYHIPGFDRIVAAPKIQVIRRGKMLLRNMRKEFLTEEKLREYIREEGIENIEEVKAAFVEGDGKVSIIKY